jgi:Leucine-rich repeat (LRR) protein
VLATGELPEAIGELTALERLYAAEAEIAALPSSLGRLARLRTLDVGHNVLTALPPALAALGELEILYVHDNRLGALPDWIGTAFPRLTYLNAAENGLTALPVLDGLPALIELRLMHNSLSDLPALPVTLRELHLRGNAFAHVPDVGRSLRCLRANRLSAVPDWLAELPALEKLDLRWNSFDDPPAAPPGLRERGCVVLIE